MGYKYEVHLHTSIGSACGVSHGQEYIDYFKSQGYDGIFVTEHFYLGNTCVDRSLPWDEWVEAFCKGYEELKELGDAQGLKVFFGWETTYDGDDFLYYGPDKAWLKAHPDIIHWDHKRCYEEVKKAGGFVVQAHPFRDRGYITDIHLHPYQADAWEVANAGNEAWNDLLAYQFACKHGLIMTCGSDMHKAGSTHLGIPFPMITEEPIRDVHDYGPVVMSGRYTMGIPENHFEIPYQPPVKPVHLYDRENREIEQCGP